MQTKCYVNNQQYVRQSTHDSSSSIGTVCHKTTLDTGQDHGSLNTPYATRRHWTLGRIMAVWAHRMPKDDTGHWAGSWQSEHTVCHKTTLGRIMAVWAHRMPQGDTGHWAGSWQSEHTVCHKATLDTGQDHGSLSTPYATRRHWTLGRIMAVWAHRMPQGDTGHWAGSWQSEHTVCHKTTLDTGQNHGRIMAVWAFVQLTMHSAFTQNGTQNNKYLTTLSKIALLQHIRVYCDTNAWNYPDHIYIVCFWLFHCILAIFF